MKMFLLTLTGMWYIPQNSDYESEQSEFHQPKSLLINNANHCYSALLLSF